MTAQTIKRASLFISFLVLILPGSGAAAPKERSVMEIPMGSSGMIAYGSLMSLQSMEQTLGHKYEGPRRQVHLNGYEREWTCVRPFNDPEAMAAGRPKIDAFLMTGTERVPVTGAAELNIYPKDEGRINGILYLVTDEELASLDKRERGYRRVDVTDRVEEFDFRGGKVYVFEGRPSPANVSPPAQGTYILVKEFLDMVTGACDAIGKEFREEFDSSTRPCAYPVVPYKNVIWEKAKVPGLEAGRRSAIVPS
jgi:hypothetical protein